MKLKYIILSCIYTFMMMTYNNTFGQITGDTIKINRAGLGKNYFYNGKKLTLKELSKIVESNVFASKEIRIAEACNVLSCIVAFGGGFCLGYPLGVLLAGREPSWILAGMGEHLS